jgi:hypothetical protein
MKRNVKRRGGDADIFILNLGAHRPRASQKGGLPSMRFAG